MPQKMNVLCCCSCQMHQVHIVKKEKKWECKVCGEKQSLVKVFFEGSGKDCRSAVQNLNFAKSNELSEPKLNSHDYFSQDTNEEYFNQSDLISSLQNAETVLSSESLEDEPLDEDNDLSIKKSYSNCASINSINDERIENSKFEKENEEKGNICNFHKSGKRRNSDEDFLVSRKKLKKETCFRDLIEKSDNETSFADLIEESDSDSQIEPQILESKVNNSIFETNCDIDFFLDF